LEHFFLIPPAFLPGIDAGTLNMGLMGYNGVLCSIALGNKNLKSLVWTSCSVLLSVVLQVIGMNLGITTLTAPFVISVWVNTEVDDFATVYQTFLEISIKSFPKGV
jgi:urea transporter